MTSTPSGQVAGVPPQPHAFHEPTPSTGLIAGTVILTADGEIPVEFLSEGDRIITRDAGMVRLRSIIRQECTVPVIRIAAGSLGDTRPEEDMLIPAGQRILVRDWRAKAMGGARQALMRGDALTDGEFVHSLGTRRVVLLHLVFDRPHVIYAGGLEIEAALPRACVLKQAA